MYVPLMQKVTLAKIFINANKKSYTLSKVPVSKENIDRILNPPQSLIVRNNLNKWEIGSISLNSNLIISFKRESKKINY